MKEVTRQGLYELVWSMPMRDAAATIPMSDVGLKKVCRRHGVPVPPRGYWNKARAGHRWRQKPLPPVQDGESETITIFASTPLHGAALESKNRAIARARELRAPKSLSRQHCTSVQSERRRPYRNCIPIAVERCDC
jgi:hypothetical protein